MGLYQFSRRLTYFLRHGAKKTNAPIMSDGFIYVDELLKVSYFSNHTFEDVLEAVEKNKKKRYLLVKDENDRWKIKACQGHTMELPDLNLTPILNSNDAPIVIHGTLKTAWESIKNEGLSRMGRQHIHFCPGLRGSNDVVSGFRSDSEVLIYIDIDQAMKDGLQFFRSENNVILSPGDANGLIHPRYFKHVKFLG